MQSQQTLSIIKPDAVEQNLIGAINRLLEAAELRIIAMKMIQMDVEQAGRFYAEHAGRAFFDSLTRYMSSGPIVVQVLQGQDAIEVNRRLMGATDPAKAEPGSIRASFASSIEANAVHGSDSPAAAQREIAFFFNSDQLYPR